MTPEELMEYLGVTRRWITRQVAERPDFPRHKLGPDQRSRLRFRASEIDAWIIATNQDA